MNMVMRMFAPSTLIDGFRGWSVAAYTWLAVATIAILGISISWGETPVGMISSITGVICVVMVARGKIANYAFGLINVILYGYIAYSATYYGDAMLNWIFYLPLQFVGFYMWDQQQRKQDSATVKMRKMTWAMVAGLTAVAAALIGGYMIVLTALGDALPLADSATTVLSIIAMILMVMRFAEQWACWVIVNVISIGMWVVAVSVGDGAGIATLMMWLVFLVNSVYGWINWYKQGEVANAVIE